MQRALLNLVGLRASRSGPISDRDGRASGSSLSRRRALGLAGVTAAGASPTLRALENSLLGSFELVRRGKGVVAFRHGGVDRWVVDVRRFAGSPALRLQQTPDTVQLELRGARYPGTDLPADFRCTIHRGATGWGIRMQMALGGFAGTAPFIGWLLGLSTLRSNVGLEKSSVGLGTAASLGLEGPARATFCPDWHTDLAGKAIATVEGLGKPLVADNAELGVLAPGATSLLQAPSSMRTTLTLWRGKRTWRLQPAFQPTGRWQLLAPSGAFDSLTFELGEGAAQPAATTSASAQPAGVHAAQPEAGLLPRPEAAGNKRTAALVAEAGAGLLFQPHSGLKGVGGLAASLPLCGARYAIAFDPAGDHRSLVARFGSQPTWLKAGSCVLEVGDTATAPPLELVAHGSSVTNVRCTPAVLTASIPVVGGVAAPVKMPAGTHLAFVAKGLERPGEQHAAQVHLSDHPLDAFQHLTMSPLGSISVVRPDDLLALVFEFVNMQLEVPDSGSPVAVPSVAAGSSGQYGTTDPYLVVHFQGQNFAETAYFEYTASTPVPDSYPDPVKGATAPTDPDQGNTTTDTPDKQPVRAYLAGESLLAFGMPPGTSLPLTLNALLDWSQLVPSLSSLALPRGETHSDVDLEDSQRHQPNLSADGQLGGCITSLEIPWHLWISPNRYAAWIHSFTPVTHNSFTELWHTRLGVKVTVPATTTRKLLAPHVSGPTTTVQVVGKNSTSLAATSTANQAMALSLSNTYLLPGHTYLLDSHYAFEVQDTPDGTKYAVTQDTYSGGLPLDAAHDYRTIRAVYSTGYESPDAPSFGSEALLEDDFDYPGDTPPARTSLTSRDRAQIVGLTSSYLYLTYALIEQLPYANVTPPVGESQPVLMPYNPVPVDVNRLMLTTLGAWVDFHGAWPDADHIGVALEEWTHRSTQGRDNYVRVVYKGYLFPFGHRATLVKVTERKFYPPSKPGQLKIAYLFQRMFIVVREPLKQYDSSHLQAKDGKPLVDMDPSDAQKPKRQVGRWMPFQQVQITTTTTPDINPPVSLFGQKGMPHGIADQDAFWPQIGGASNPQDILFHCIGQDCEGQRVEFTAPLAFISVEEDLAFDSTNMQTVETLYSQDPRNTVALHGAKIAYAPSNRPGDTTLHTTDMVFDVYLSDTGQRPETWLIQNDEPCFVPVMAQAHVSIPAVEALFHNGQVPAIALSDHYLRDGIGAADPTGTGNNPGEVFADIVQENGSTSPDITYGSKGSNGSNSACVVAPNLTISALSRVLGPIGGSKPISSMKPLPGQTAPPTSVDLIATAPYSFSGPAPAGGGGASDVGSFLDSFFDQNAKILGAISLSQLIHLPPLGPSLGILTAAQSIENVPGTIGQLGAGAIDPALAQLATLGTDAQAGAMRALQNQLAPVQALLQAAQSALSTLQTALSSAGGAALLHAGDLGKIKKLLDTAVSNIQPLDDALTPFMQSLGASSVPSDLTSQATAVKTAATNFSTSLQNVLSTLGTLRGLNPLPALKHAQLPDAVDVHLKWAPHLVDKYDDGFVKFTPGSGDDDQFISVSADIHTPLTGSDSPTFAVTGKLGAFTVELLDIIQIIFTGITFTAKSGAKPDIAVPTVQVVPQGDLQFVYDLMKIIPSSGFSDPPFLDITEDGLATGFNFDLPALTLGMFSLDNISFGAKVTMPWIGSSPAQVNFNFCTRENPFHLTVCMCGGGGYFGITLGLDGLDMLEAGLEFGADLSLNFGIASGTVSVMAGIYFKMDNGSDQSSDSSSDQSSDDGSDPSSDTSLQTSPGTKVQTTKLGGYVHIHGDVEVGGGIVSVSIDVSITLGYENDGGTSYATGEASLSISVHLVFFSISASVDVQRKFGGSDPDFRDQVPLDKWAEYWGAFAPEMIASQ